MNRRRKIVVIALFVTTLLIGGAAIFIGYRLSQQGLAPEDSAAYELVGRGCIESRWCDEDADPNDSCLDDRYNTPGNTGGGCRSGCPPYAQQVNTMYRCERQQPSGSGCQDNPDYVNLDFLDPYCGTQQLDYCDGHFESRYYDDCAVSPTPTTPGTTQPPVTEPPTTGQVTPTPSRTATPTPTTPPSMFAIEAWAYCVDTGANFRIQNAIVQLLRNNHPDVNQRNIQLTTGSNGQTPFLNNELQSYNGYAVRLNSQYNAGRMLTLISNTGSIQRNFDDLVPTNINSTISNTDDVCFDASQGETRGTEGKCDCTNNTSYEHCNLVPNKSAPHSPNVYTFNFFFSNCLASTTSTPTPTPTRTPTPTPTGTITVTPTGSPTPTPSITPTINVPQCGDTCSASADNCAPGTGCYDTGGGVFQCALDQCIANPSLCNPDLCSFADAVNVDKTAVMTCINGGDTAQVDYSVVIANTLANSRTINVADDLDSKVQSSYVQNATITLGGIHNNGVINWSNLNLPGSSTGTTLTLNYRLLIPQSAFGTYTNTVTVNEGGVIRGTDTVAINVNCLPGTALISDKADRLIFAVIMITTGIMIFRFGLHRDIGNWAWYHFGDAALAKISPRYRKQRFEKKLAKGARKTKSRKN